MIQLNAPYPTRMTAQQAEGAVNEVRAAFRAVDLDAAARTLGQQATFKYGRSIRNALDDAEHSSGRNRAYHLDEAARYVQNLRDAAERGSR